MAVVAALTVVSAPSRDFVKTGPNTKQRVMVSRLAVFPLLRIHLAVCRRLADLTIHPTASSASPATSDGATISSNGLNPLRG